MRSESIIHYIVLPIVFFSLGIVATLWYQRMYIQSTSLSNNDDNGIIIHVNVTVPKDTIIYIQPLKEKVSSNNKTIKH